jgi:hypothetical protein
VRADRTGLGWYGFSAHELVTGLLDGGADLRLVERVVAGDGDGAAGQVHRDVGDAVDRGDLLVTDMTQCAHVMPLTV